MQLTLNDELKFLQKMCQSKSIRSQITFNFSYNAVMEPFPNVRLHVVEDDSPFKGVRMRNVDKDQNFVATAKATAESRRALMQIAPASVALEEIVRGVLVLFFLFLLCFTRFRHVGPTADDGGLPCD